MGENNKNNLNIGLVDADYALYAFGNYPIEEAIIRTNSWLDWIKLKTNSSKLFLFISGIDNFRYKIATTRPYKANRQNKDVPISYSELKTYLSQQTYSVVVNGAEADDGISIFNSQYKDKFNITIISDDKDLLAIHGKHYRHTNNEFINVTDNIISKLIHKVAADFTVKTITVSEYLGKFRLYQQMLVGDAADSIVGIPNMGINNKIFKTIFVKGISLETARDIVWHEYLKCYGENAVLVYYEHFRLLKLISNN